jgi:pantoate--beta-alanine ligase
MRLEMVVANTIKALQEAKKMFKGSVGFIPTMGALHQGHLSLIQRAKKENAHVIVSIFVNPTQFLEGEDLEAYPRRVEADREICRHAGVDILFMPTSDEIYTKDEISIGAPAIRGYIFEGQKRPGHFDGMLQVVMKLLHLSSATHAYFGKKDAQQLVLITQMVQNYFIDVTIVPCDIVRDNSGLALSSRNAYLNQEEKKRALSLSQSLKKATSLISNGELRSSAIQEEMSKTLSNVDKVDYIAIVTREFQPSQKVEVGNTIILVASWVGKTRLIDNVWV